jgi:hypothetical protein
MVSAARDEVFPAVKRKPDLGNGFLNVKLTKIENPSMRFVR